LQTAVDLGVSVLCVCRGCAFAARMFAFAESVGCTPMAQGRSTKIISMIKWIRTSRLSIKNSLSVGVQVEALTQEVQQLRRSEDDVARPSFLA